MVHEDPRTSEQQEVQDELPRGALLMTLAYLLLLVALWVQVYMHLFVSGGIPNS